MKALNFLKFVIRGLTAALCLFAVSCPLSAQTSDFGTWFEPKSLRIDFALSGNSEGQSAAIQQLREEPLFAGPKKNLLDRTGRGGYYVHVYDKVSGRLIYSRGFNTLFEEWLSTEQAEAETQSWSNSISVPYPKNTVEFELLARSKEDMKFYSLLKFDIDPASIFIDRSPLDSNTVTDIVINGDHVDKVDLVFLAEGYTAAEQDKFLQDARRFTDILFETPPFDDRKGDFNVRAVGLVSRDSGTDVSAKGIFRNTALNSGYYTFGIERYLTTPDMKSIRDAVWDVPCDAIFILVNTDTYGGGGMYNFYAIGTSDNSYTPVVFTHEFGHSFAGLADEYFSSEVAYNDDFHCLDTEPWEPNITTLVDFASKWQDMLEEGIPVPTPVDEKYGKGLGVFEGGGYQSEGIFRPVDNCMMRNYAPFCPVCTRAILEMVDYYCDRDY